MIALLGVVVTCAVIIVTTMIAAEFLGRLIARLVERLSKDE